MAIEGRYISVCVIIPFTLEACLHVSVLQVHQPGSYWRTVKT